MFTDIKQVLNEAEIADIKAQRIMLSPLMDDYARRVVWEVAYEVDKFTHGLLGHGPSEAAKWFLRVAEAIVSDDGGIFELGCYKYNLSCDEVVSTIEAKIDSVFTDYKEDWVYDPIAFAKWHSHAEIGPEGPIEHPWTDYTVIILREWLKARPYRIWTVAEAVRKAVKEATEENLLDMVVGNADCDIPKVAEKAFEEAVGKMVVTLKAEREAFVLSGAAE